MSVESDRLDDWVAEGFLSADQASAIREYERRPSAGHPTAVLEVLGYVGAVFVVVAGLLLVVDLWEDLSRAARVALVGSTALVLVIGGLVVVRTKHPRIRRVGSTLLLLALVPTGVAVGLVAEANVDEEAATLVGFSAATILALVLYRHDRSIPQHAGLFLSSMGTVLFAMVIIDDVADWVPGLALFIGGVAWIVLASFEIVVPRSFGEAAGSSAALLGAFIAIASLSFDENTSAAVLMVLAVLVALLAIGFGVARDRILVVVAGMAGLIIFLPWLVNEALGENVGAPIALFIAGSLLIGSAVYLTKRGRL